MKRQEALAVLHEIYDVCKETVIMNCISLDSKEAHLAEGTNGFEIRIKCHLDKRSRECIKPILKKHELEIKEGKGIVIFRSKKKQCYAVP